ncbi:GNAT family N-acetyltransferase [Falsihalocynthiibacter sp. SS001]|uniref:GNAT family N-acetyltransferase n=1 Tax=Falsihalocynthiibacter sp. SS001 TaxID=3349698 RepID=UPI0036D2D198
MIREATADDIPAILDIWNPVIRESIFTFNSQEKSPQDVQETLTQKAANAEPFLIAVEGTNLLGFATYGQFRGGVGYRFTVEHTIILAPAARGRGVGRHLLEAVESHARTREMHSMIAGVSGENANAIRFHAAMGYVEYTRLPEVGHKFGRWFDLVLMQKRL